MKSMLTIFVLILGFNLGANAQVQTTKFWTVERFSVTTILTAEVSYDGYTTQYIEHHGGQEANPFAKFFVKHGTIGQVAAGELGGGAVLGLQYTAHRLHHERVANWIGRIAITGEGLNCIKQHRTQKRYQ